MADDKKQPPALIVPDQAINVIAKDPQEVVQNAETFAKALLNQDPEDHDQRKEGKEAVGGLAFQLQKEAMLQSEMLKAPLKQLSARGSEGGEVAKSLIDLKVQVESLDPARMDFEGGWFSRAVGKIPGVGTPMKRYFSKFESAQSVISAVLKSLELGKGQLQRDNTTLGEDQKKMRELTQKLAQAIVFGQEVDKKLQYALDREIPAESEKHKFIGEEILFPLRQRILDLQQQLAVNQQGVIAIELIVRNNDELKRGVDRALNVTVGALQVGVTVALALENQKIVLDKIDAVSKTTSDLIAGTANRLKTQGVQIQQRASSTTLSMESLKSAFADLRTALDDISKFRQAALPQMAQKVLELDQMTADAKKTIEKIDQGREQRKKIGKIE